MQNLGDNSSGKTTVRGKITPPLGQLPPGKRWEKSVNATPHRPRQSLTLGLQKNYTQRFQVATWMRLTVAAAACIQLVEEWCSEEKLSDKTICANTQNCAADFARTHFVFYVGKDKKECERTKPFERNKYIFQSSWYIYTRICNVYVTKRRFFEAPTPYYIWMYFQRPLRR